MGSWREESAVARTPVTHARVFQQGSYETRQELVMETRITNVLMAAVLLWLMPQSAWASSRPAVAGFGTNIIITRGRCEVRPPGIQVPLRYDETTERWECVTSGQLPADAEIKIILRMEKLDHGCHNIGGVQHAGTCWRKGRPGWSCTRVCNAMGLQYDDMTATYAGTTDDGGTRRHCAAVARALGDGPRSVPRDNEGINSDDGCGQFHWSSDHAWTSHGSTTESATAWDFRRYCACARDID